MILKQHPNKTKPGCIIVKVLGKEERTETNSGIYLGSAEQERSKSKFTTAEVIKVGEDFLNYEMVCKEGDTIIINETPTEKGDYFYFIGDDRFFIISENDYYYATIDG